MPLLEIKNLAISFKTSAGSGRAVDGISITLNRNETVGVVGESGCGKSVTAMSILKLLQEPPAKIESGSILFEGKDILTMSNKELQKIRGNKISMIFQEPMTALNPVFTIGDQIGEVYQIHQSAGKKEAKQRAIEMLNRVGIPDAATRADEYPHQLSGGMRQRVMIAMALAINPAVLIADEPTTALDVTVQAEILELMDALKKEFGTSILFITHDLGVIAKHADRLVVMYAGKVVEQGSVRDIFKKPAHPYTACLMASIPSITDHGRKELTEIKGMVPPLHDRPSGCLFHPRCPKAVEDCKKQQPELKEINPNHYAACILA